MTWGPQYAASLSRDDEDDLVAVPDLCTRIGPLMPGPGESREEVAEIIAHAHVSVVDLCAGTAAETLLHTDDEPWVAHSDITKARALAGLICSDQEAVDAYLRFGLADAKAIVRKFRVHVLAVAEALIAHRTLDAVQIDDILTAAPERARRAEWKDITDRVASSAVPFEIVR